jgi:hypothetical protein
MTRDSVVITQAACPGCYIWADLDEDQAEGKVSMICPECGWHGYINDKP